MPAAPKSRLGRGLGGLIASAAPAVPPAAKADPAAAPSATPPPQAQRFGSSSYMVVTKQMPWSEAKAQAEKMGGHLATITSAEEPQCLT